MQTTFHRTPIVRAALLAAFCLLTIAAPCRALPPGFVQETIIDGWLVSVGICFAPDGRGFVWEKRGAVWLVENGVKSAQPLIDISEEVGHWRDVGLLGFAIDPDFYANGHIYLLYGVDYHHLRYFGTPQYSPTANEYNHDTICRLTRYTCNAADGFRSVDYSSRRVLIGESISTGFPVTHEGHTIGTVLFGEDGSLFAGTGDGANYLGPDPGGFRPGSSNTALADGIITPEEDVGAFRAQMIDSLSGKIVRVDPATGDGIPGNPFFDPENPRSARSRVWAMGMRNPFRFTLRPGTGGHGGTGDPGTLYIGDVGWYSREELNIAPIGGLNFGWPLFEGVETTPMYPEVSPANLRAPNPLFGVAGCMAPFFNFTHLIAQASLAAPSWPNPCDPAQQIASATPTFVHTLPVLEWGHSGEARVPVFDDGELEAVALGSDDCPVEGEPFTGGMSSSGGVWYTGSAFPPEYRNAFFAADFAGGWIKVLEFDDQDRLLSVRPFLDGLSGIVYIGYNHVDEALYVLSIDNFGFGTLRRIVSTLDAAPSTAAAATPPFGPLPLNIQFSSAGTSDPEGQPLSIVWDFGDGSAPRHAANPQHTYSGVIDLTSRGTITARVFELIPPFPYGGGNPDPEIIRDKDYPPVGSGDSLRQYDTLHDGHQGTLEYIGYTFPTNYIINRLVFQEGKHFFDGGWFESLTVEYRSGGVWTPVPGLVTTPAYPGNNGVNFETFVFTFQSVLADGIRIRGVPGGINRFISVGELRASGLPVGIGNAPRRYDVTMTATDPAGNAATAELVVSAANTPPQVTITSPVDGSLYRLTSEVEVPLRATITDAQHPPSQLSCAWQVILHHNTHSHPEPAMSDCEPSVLISPIGCDGETYFYEISLTVTDAHGLATTRSSYVFPNCCLADWTGNGLINSDDISSFLTSWLSSVGSGSLEADFTGDGAVNSNDISAFLTAWLEGVPIGC